MPRYSNNYSMASLNEGSLFKRTMLVVAGMNVLSFVGSSLTWDLPLTMGILFGTFVLNMILLFAMHLTVRSAPQVSLALAFLFAGIEGATLGPVFNHYVDVLGPNLFSVVCLGTAGTIGIAGIVSTMLTFDYRKVESYLMVILLGMIVVGVVTMFTGMTAGINILYSILGVVLFTAFFIVDFMRLRAENLEGLNGWGHVAITATKLYLDQINLLLYALRLAAALKKN